MRQLKKVCARMMAPMLLAALGASPAFSWNEQVVAACLSGQQSDNDVFVCHTYIEGYLDGALVTDAAVVETVARSEGETSEFVKRAYLTRVGSKRKNLPATALAHFCLPESVTRPDIVGSIGDALKSADIISDTLSEAVYEILKKQYPCGETSTAMP
jgi:hypothetical protein